METFLYREINRAHREMDDSKVDTLGPFSYILSQATVYNHPENETLM